MVYNYLANFQISIDSTTHKKFVRHNTFTSESNVLRLFLDTIFFFFCSAINKVPDNKLSEKSAVYKKKKKNWRAQPKHLTQKPNSIYFIFTLFINFDSKLATSRVSDINSKSVTNGNDKRHTEYGKNILCFHFNCCCTNVCLAFAFMDCARQNVSCPTL